MIVTSGSIMVEVRITPTLGVPLQTIIGGTTRAINTATGATTLTLEGEVPEANVVTVVATPTPIDSTGQVTSALTSLGRLLRRNHRQR